VPEVNAAFEQLAHGDDGHDGPFVKARRAEPDAHRFKAVTGRPCPLVLASSAHRGGTVRPAIRRAGCGPVNFPRASPVGWPKSRGSEQVP
jgi:hypothetical protein